MRRADAELELAALKLAQQMGNAGENVSEVGLE